MADPIARDVSRVEPRPEERAPAPPPRPSSLFSPAGYAILLVLVLLSGLLGHGITVFLTSDPGASEVKSSGARYEQIHLGSFTRDLTSADDAGIITEKFSVEVALVLNPRYGDLAQIKGELDKQKDDLKNMVNEILFSKTEDNFRLPNFRQSFLDEIKQRANDYFGLTENGEGVVDRVITPVILKMPRPR